MFRSELSATAEELGINELCSYHRADNDTWSLSHLDHQFESAAPKPVITMWQLPGWLDRIAVLLPCSGQVFCLLTGTLFPLAINLSHSVKTKEIILLSQVLFS